MSTIQRYLPAVARILMGLIFFVFGLNGFLQFLPQPPLTGKALEFIMALVGTGYLFVVVKAVEVVVGALLLANRYVPLALALIAPIVVNIFLFHTVLTPPNPMAILLLVANLYLAWVYRDAYRPMLAAKVKPATPEAEPVAKPARVAA
ncbi:MAG: DoxX family protein [Minicystis sp.]